MGIKTNKLNEITDTISALSLAVTPLTRLRGLIGQKLFSGVLLLAPCKDVHTFGMKKQIDLVFLNRNGVVLKIEKRVPPNKRITCKGSVAVLECYSSSGLLQPQVGDRVCLGFGFLPFNSVE